jgi:nitrogen regulatory protein P-II 1
MMKKIEAILPSSEMDATFSVLEKMGVNFSYVNIKGRGQIPRQEVESGRGTGMVREEFNTNALIMTVVNDSMAEKVIDTILKSSSTESAGWGKIFVSELKDAIDIRSGQHGDAAAR